MCAVLGKLNSNNDLDKTHEEQQNLAFFVMISPFHFLRKCLYLDKKREQGSGQYMNNITDTHFAKRQRPDNQ